MEFSHFIPTPKVDSIILHQPFYKPLAGTLCITSHHIIVSSRKEGAGELWLLHRMVDCVERKSGTSSIALILKCKDFRILQLDIPSVEHANNISYSIENLSKLDYPTCFYPFFYRANFDILEDGWTAYSPETEYSKIMVNKDEWRISHVNKDYKICPSYPQTVIVPKSIDDETLITVANFRHLNRFPVLSYYHKETKAALLRSSQPLVGPNIKRCKEDELLLKAVLGKEKKGYIIDTRSQTLARAKGVGIEPEFHYTLWKMVHKHVDRYHVLLDSLVKLAEACCDPTSSMDKWLSRLESSGWLNHVKDVLTCSCVVAQCVGQEGACVLVHGAEGMDATLQVTSLAQIILNPDCRTVHGFEALIEREWLQAGHPFTLRCQHGAFASASVRTKEQSPSFLMFLDCVYQIHQQFPCSFEFNEEFLITLYEHSYASQFGTFLGNCDKDRNEMNLSKTTVSLWSHINRTEILSTYLNPMYEPNNKVIWPSVAPQSLVLWTSLFLRWICDQAPQKEAWQTIAKIRDRDKDLRIQALKLRRQLEELEREALNSGLLTPPPPDEIPVENS